MIRFIFIMLLFAVAARAADDRIKLDVNVLSDMPMERKTTLLRFTITGRDGSPDIAHKKEAYIVALRSMINRLLKTYYMHSEFPDGIDSAIQKRAIFEAGLRYPGSASTGASFYGDLIQRYQIRMYEEEVITIAFALCERFRERDVVVTGGPAPTFSEWKKLWDESGQIENGPNQPPEPPQNATH